MPGSDPISQSFGLEKNGECFCGGHGSSTTIRKMSFLSCENAGDVCPGVFGVLREESSHNIDVRDGRWPPILWT